MTHLPFYPYIFSSPAQPDLSPLKQRQHISTISSHACAVTIADTAICVMPPPSPHHDFLARTTIAALFLAVVQSLSVVAASSTKACITASHSKPHATLQEP
jgi:hypothetical protein